MRRTAGRRTSEALGRVARLAAAPVLALVIAVALAGCSGDDEGPDEAGSPGETGSALETDARLGAIRGPITDKRADKVLSDVTAVVERWSDQGYGGDYPRDDFAAAFGEFTKDARALASKQPAIMSNAQVGGDVEAVDLLKRVVRVDVAAPKGKAAGATARIRLKVSLSGGVERTDVVSGRLLLTPTKDGWKVFGFDVRRGEVGA